MNKLCLWTIALLALPLSAFADTSDVCTPTFKQIEHAQTYFAESIDEAEDALLDICKADKRGAVDPKALNHRLEAFHLQLQKDAKKSMPRLDGHLALFDNPLLEIEGDVISGMKPNHDIIQPDITDPTVIDGIRLSYQGNGPLTDDQKHCVPKEEATSCINDDGCHNAFKAYMKILGEVYGPLSVKPLKRSLEFLTLKDQEWAAYIKEARSQTFIDIAVTSWLYEKWYGKGEHDFGSPPGVQWFALRPNVLIENVSDAVDGDQLKESLALEVAGFNYWQDACFGVACGASLIVNYTDRNGVEDAGWGVMFHVDNSYSFGVTKHGGDTGLFVTVDLLKLFIDKKSSFDDYKEKYRSLIE